MTAATQARQPDSGDLARALLLILAATLLGAIGAILLSTHAEKHSEAEAIRQTCKRNGPNETWQHLDAPDILIWLVELSDGRFGCWFVQKWPSRNDKVDFRERTAFCPRGGSYSRVICFLREIAQRID